MKRLTQLLLLWAGCLHLCGGPLGVLQVVAWSKMLFSYSQQDGLLIGVKKTFDGEHPCPLCRQIAEQKKSENSPVPATPTDLEKLISKLGNAWFVSDLPTTPPIPWKELGLSSPLGQSHLAGELGIKPPTPPPRFA